MTVFFVSVMLASPVALVGSVVLAASVALMGSVSNKRQNNISRYNRYNSIVI